MCYNEGELKERERQEGDEVREEEGGDEHKLNDRRERREQEEEKGREKGATIFIERQSLVAFSSGGSEAHLSVFFKSTLCSNLLSLACSLPPPSLSLILSQIGLPCARGPRRERASAAASSLAVLHTDCVY